MFRKVPSDISWGHTLGSAAFTAFIVQAVTGVILAMYYVPDPDKAYESIRHITDDLTLGWLVRGMHRWGASVFIILLFLHMGRVFLYGAYKYPRELNWIIGVLILVLGMMEGFFGYLLPWDQTAYWATVVGVNLQATGPFVGPLLGNVLQGGAEIGPETLARFYSLHMLVLPGALARTDRAAPLPRGADGRRLATVVAGGRGQGATGPAAAAEGGPRLAGAERGEAAMSTRGLDERRAQHQRYKEDVKRRGKPFYPFAMFHDTVMSLLVVSLIVAMAVVWKYTADEGPAEEDSGLLGKLYDEKADPGTTNFVPRPDWYFYFLFYLLRIFKWPDTVILGTVGIPTIALILLLALPFIDHSPRATTDAPARRDGRGAADDRLDGRPHVQGRDGGGAARDGERGARAGVGRAAGLQRQRRRDGGRGDLRAGRVYELSHVPRRRRVESGWRRTCPNRQDVEPRRRRVRAVRRRPNSVREHGDAAVRRAWARRTCGSSASSSSRPAACEPRTDACPSAGGQ